MLIKKLDIIRKEAIPDAQKLQELTLKMTKSQNDPTSNMLAEMGQHANIQAFANAYLETGEQFGIYPEPEFYTDAELEAALEQ